MRRDCRERFPRDQLQGKTQVSDPGMHHGTCVTHVSWCMPGSLFCGGGENVPGIPGACATRNFTYLVRGPCTVCIYRWLSARLQYLQCVTTKPSICLVCDVQDTLYICLIKCYLIRIIDQINNSTIWLIFSSNIHVSSRRPIRQLSLDVCMAISCKQTNSKLHYFCYIDCSRFQSTNQFSSFPGGRNDIFSLSHNNVP